MYNFRATVKQYYTFIFHEGHETVLTIFLQRVYNSIDCMLQIDETLSTYISFVLHF